MGVDGERRGVVGEMKRHMEILALWAAAKAKTAPKVQQKLIQFWNGFKRASLPYKTCTHTVVSVCASVCVRVKILCLRAETKSEKVLWKLFGKQQTEICAKVFCVFVVGLYTLQGSWKLRGMSVVDMHNW